MIKLEKVEKIFKRKDVKVEALKGITFNIDKGDIFGVIGFSGAGKSTLLRTINYLEKPTSGKVIVNGKNLAKLNKKELRDLRKQIGMVFQHFNLLNSKTVFDNIAIALILNKTPKFQIESKVNELLKFVGLEDKSKAYPDELSGGQKQRIGIARALATDPLILLCDEATSALDPETTQSVLELLKKINKKYNITILIITHEMNVIREVCNKVAVMEKGQIIEEGNLIDIFGNPKKQTTKNFVRTVVHDDVPKSILEEFDFHDINKKLLEVKFLGKSAKESIIADASAKAGVNMNILYANFTELSKDILGYITIEAEGEKENIDNAINIIKDKGVKVREVVL
ncbi:ATP-binding cassette domain-containing protein [Clostridium sp. BJN0001]|uniref:methionine ABC transporter ATP-binding protein n=1 Tax=Clostridium sp. BJN0001 TaxID=2930219 RepID=UPI001FD33C9D|nr:ATP-binding cassette domain-containing protein [Clostridium sp. BJN0001]